MSRQDEEIRQAIEAERPSHVFALFSGGHDSVCSLQFAAQLPNFAGVIHCNTGFGIEETREYVRDTCTSLGYPLLEEYPDRYTYRDLVMGTWGRDSKTGERRFYRGFPGGARSHMRFYYYLKQRSIDRVVQRYKTHHKDRIGLVTGIRREESDRRMAGAFAEYAQRDGAQLWLNPILDWSQQDKNAYMASQGLPRNQVVDTLHRSGECLCGALTRKREFRDIEVWYPQFAAQIKALEAEVQAKHPDMTEGAFWGRRGERENPDQLDFLPLCSSCVMEAA